MKQKVKVTICACSNCMNTGASEIAHAIENLAEIEGLLKEGQEIQIVAKTLLAEENHSENCPVIAVEDKLFESAKAEEITAAILEILKEGE